MKRRLVHPPIEIVSSVVSDALTPLVVQFERELGLALPTLVTIWSSHMIGPRVLLLTSGSIDPPPEHSGEVRLMFEEGFQHGRFLFFGQAIYKKDVSPDTGWSGFHVKGDARIGTGGKITVRTKGWTVTYNSWNWEAAI